MMQGAATTKTAAKYSGNYSGVVLAVGAGLLLAGCGSVPRVEIQEVKVPVPVECREPIPERPSMPMEALADDADPFTLLRAALAEIDRREGYEVRLLAALLMCTRPVSPAAAGDGRPGPAAAGDDRRITSASG